MEINPDVSLNKEFASNTSELIKKFVDLTGKEKISVAAQFYRGLLLRKKVDTSGWILAGKRVTIKKENGIILINRLCRLRANVQIAVIGRSADLKAQLSIGYNSEIGTGTKINVSTSLAIGSECMIGWKCDILDTDFHSIIYSNGQQMSSSKPIIIEDHVWVGCDSIILKGVTIGHDSVIAAGSVIVSNVPPFSIMRGNPARFVMQINGWSSKPYYE